MSKPRTRSPRRRPALALAVGACVLALEATAAAGGADAATAQVLFEDGKRLAAASKFAEACPKFAESQRLDPAAGTLIHLGNCHEKLGKTASAWATFLEAAAAAKQQGRADWAELATARAEALRPKLARLAIVVSERPPGLVVKRDGTVLTEASLGAPFPVDPGSHTVEISAPGRAPLSLSRVVRDGEQATLQTPPLAHEAAPPPPPLVAAPPPSTSPTPAPAPAREPERGAGLGYVVAGLGVAGLGVGALTGVLAMSKNSESKDLCPTEGRCASQAGVAANDSAKTLGTVSTIAFIAGGVGVVAGVTLVLTSGSKSRPSATLSVAPSLGGLLVRGAF
ncbi:MAG TPA: hypothetical protein PLR99_08930 [Polyangiaceae bacterium]|nr:hypothetical protein [Polyangiaceae bacterium]